MEQKLEPCPFCGSVALIYDQNYNELALNGTGQITCQHCGASGPKAHFTLPCLSEGHAAVIRNWNDRKITRLEPINKIISIGMTAAIQNGKRHYQKTIRFPVVSPARGCWSFALDAGEKIDTAYIELEYEARSVVGDTIIYELSDIEVKR